MSDSEGSENYDGNGDYYNGDENGVENYDDGGENHYGDEGVYDPPEDVYDPPEDVYQPADEVSDYDPELEAPQEEEVEQSNYYDRSRSDPYSQSQDNYFTSQSGGHYSNDLYGQQPSYHYGDVDVGEQLSGMQRLNLDAPEAISHASQQWDDGSNSAASAFNFGSIMKGALDGFGGGSMSEIVGKIGNLTGGQGGLSNLMASGGLEAMASGAIANAAHHFFGINPETGRIIGAIAGNLIFHLGGKDNSLSGIGKIVLDNIISGKYHRKVDPFVPATPGMPSFNLNFAEERNRCLRERRLFEDPEFSATDSSLYFSKPPKKQIEWKRPGEIVHDPQLIVSHQSRFDVVQGSLGDCWLLAAAANLTLRDELFYRVVPPDQSFTENYAGIFHFQFWRYGKWVDVVVDDRLPTHNGELIYMHSAQHNEFWSALLEKAYAKLYGNYETLKGGSTAEAMEDFTGGLIEYFDLADAPREQMLAMLVRGFQMGSLFGCSIDADANVVEAQMDNGLVRGHAYSITALQTVQTSRGEVVLLRIRNPWGEHEWNGAWSDHSAEWNYVGEEQRQRLDVSFADDGEFWMCIDDFLREFQRMENCNLGPEVMNEIYEMTGLTGAPKSAWTSFMADGGWVSANGTAGGCRNNLETFCNNPQYGTALSVSGNAVDQDGKVTVIVAILQKYRRELRVKNLDSLPIGFAVFRSTGVLSIPSAPQPSSPPSDGYSALDVGYYGGTNTASSGSYYGRNNTSSSKYYGGNDTGGSYYGPGGVGYGAGYYGGGSGAPSSVNYYSGAASKNYHGGDCGTPANTAGEAPKMDRSFFEHAETVAKSPSFIDLREVTTRFRVEPGTYVIVPSTFDPNEDAEFLLRVFSSGQITATELR